MTSTGPGSSPTGDHDGPPGDEPPTLDALAPPPTRTRSGAWLVAAGAIVAVVALLAVVTLTRSPTDDLATPTTTGPGPAQDDRATELGVNAPYDGKASMRLPVTVTPNRDLVDGQTVTVSGSGFPPGADIGVIMCTNDAVFDGIAACDISTAMSSISRTTTAITVDADGRFSVPYQVRFHFSVAEPTAVAPAPTTSLDPNGSMIIQSSSAAPQRSIDCTQGDIDPDLWPQVIPPTAESDPGGSTCIIAAGMVNDYDTSGGAAIGAAGATFTTFDPSQIHAPPTVAPDPDAPEPPSTASTSLVGPLPTTSPDLATTTVPSTPPIGASTTTTGPPADRPEPPLEPGSTTTTGPPGS